MLGLWLVVCVVTIVTTITSIPLVAQYLSRIQQIRRTSMKENIWLQPGTRAHMLVYKGDVWQVWTSTNSRTGDSDLWYGTYMELHPDGKCVQCTREQDRIDYITIRPALGGSGND